MTTEFRSEGAADGGVKQRAAETASTAATTAVGGAKEVAGTAVEQTKQVAGQAKDQVRQLAQQTSTEVKQQADAKTQQATEHIRTMSTAIRSLLEGRPEEASAVTSYLEEAQGKLESFASRLEGGGASGVAEELSSFARRRPGTFLAAAAVFGFAAGRVARAGTAVMHDQQSSSPSSMGMGTQPVGIIDGPAASGTESMDLIAATPVFGDPIGTSPVGTTGLPGTTGLAELP